MEENNTYKRNVKEYKLTLDTTFGFNIEDNLVYYNDTWKIKFTIWDKKYEYDISELKNKDSKFSEDWWDTLMSLSKNWEIYYLEWDLMWKKIKSVEVLSCDNNWDTYEDSYYKSKKFMPWDNEYQYNIYENYWNLCKIPYFLKLTDMDWKVTKQEFSLNID